MISPLLESRLIELLDSYNIQITQRVYGDTIKKIAQNMPCKVNPFSLREIYDNSNCPFEKIHAIKQSSQLIPEQEDLLSNMLPFFKREAVLPTGYFIEYRALCDEQEKLNEQNYSNTKITCEEIYIRMDITSSPILTIYCDVQDGVIIPQLSHLTDFKKIKDKVKVKNIFQKMQNANHKMLETKQAQDLMYDVVYCLLGKTIN
jgi:hypothetical protein